MMTLVKVAVVIVGVVGIALVVVLCRVAGQDE